MRLIGGMLARNEGYIIGMTARAALLWLDELVIFVHASTDNTAEIASQVAREHPGRVTILTDGDPVWREMLFRQRMLDAARVRGATHFATVDADEMMTSNLLPQIKSIIENGPRKSIFEPPWVCLAGGLDRYYAGGKWYANWVSVSFRDDPQFYWEARNGYDHHHRRPMGLPMDRYNPIRQSYSPEQHEGGLMHFQFVNARRLKAKQFWYQLIEKQRWGYVRADYAGTVEHSDPGKYATAACPGSWFTGYGDFMMHYYPDAEPWHIEEIKRIVAENPGITKGLDDFGLLTDLELPRAA